MYTQKESLLIIWFYKKLIKGNGADLLLHSYLFTGINIMRDAFTSHSKTSAGT